MAYTTPDDVRLVTAGDSNASGLDTPASLSDEALLDSIRRASSRVDARLTGHYGVPFPAPVPALISEITEGLAVFYATLTARRGSPVGQDDPARLRYADALSQLDQLATGALVIDGADPPAGGAGEVGVVQPWTGDLFTPDDFHLTYGWR